MKIQTYEDWKEAVSSEYKKLDAVRDYLNEDGRERLKVFKLMDSLTVFAESAADMVKLLEKDEDMPDSKHSDAPIKALRKVAKEDEENG